MVKPDKIEFGRVECAISDASSFEDLRIDPLLSQIKAYFEEESADFSVCSFDVFDTLLLRDSRSELERFYCVAQSFSENLALLRNGNAPSPKSCVASRIFAAHNAYQMGPMVNGCIEGQYHEIVQNTVDTLQLNGQEVFDLWLECENQIEIEQTKLSPLVVDLIDQALASGKRVILLSDMYYTSAQIKNLLSAHEFDIDKIERTFSSADLIVNKRSGQVFSEVADRLEVDKSSIIHIGDSLHSDYVMPRTSGLSSLHLPVPNTIAKARQKSHFDLMSKLFPDDRGCLPIFPPPL